MKVVCFDTSGAHLVAAAFDSADRGALVAGVTRDARAQELLDVLEELLAAAGWTRADVEAIAVGVGPGGFTGVRVGVATARGLAEALDVPLHAVPSLLALVASDTELPAESSTAWAALDARRGEFFVQPFARFAGGWAATTDASTIPAADVDGLGLGIVRLASPTPEGLARAAATTLDEGDGDPLTVTPHYVRGPDAEPPRPRLRIDDMRTSDLDAVLGIERRSFPTPWSEAMYAEELKRSERGDGFAVVARDLTGGARVVGAVLGAWMGDSWHVMNVLVDPPARRRGIASQLLDALLERTSAHAFGVGEGWTLEVRDGNAAAIGLYESRGFVNRGRRPGYYSDTGEDAIIMWRDASPVEVPA